MKTLRLPPAQRRAVSSGNRLGSFLRTSGKSLEQALLELHAVQEMGEFWKTTQHVLHEALPLHFICLCLRPFALMPSTVFRERAPFASEEEFKLFQELNPLGAFLGARPGTTLVRMSEILSDGDLVQTEFFRRFMQPHDDRFFACFNFWHAGVFQGMIGLHRTTDQGDFTNAEMAFLARLHPHFNMVIQRILSIHRERAVRLSLEQLLVNLPIATAVLDWELRVTYRNRTAIELCALWNLGPERAHREKYADDFELPPQVLAFCRDFKARWNPCHHRACPLTSAEGATLAHPGIAGLRASVNLLQLDAAPLSMPIFLVRLEHTGGAANGVGGPAQSSDGMFQQFARLSLREREVALLVGQGCTNDEVARRLGKSVLTVKKQLRSIFKKLEITTRHRLIAMLR